MKLSSRELYRLISKENTSNTETTALSNELHNFYDNVIAPLCKDDTELAYETYDKFVKLTYDYNEQGFVSGFETAVSLLSNHDSN